MLCAELFILAANSNTNKRGFMKDLKMETQSGNGNMKTLKHSLMALSVLLIVGCQPNEKEKTKETIRVSANDRMTSDELTSSAEQLIGPYTFMLSHKMAKLAYEKDPTNIKAGFIMYLTKRFEAYRGLYTRVRPLLKPDQIEAYNRWAREFPNSPLKTFLMDSGKPITGVQEIQDVIGEYYSAVNEFRQFMIKYQDARFEIQMNPHVFEKEIKEEMVDSCQVQESIENGTEVVCDHSEVATKKLNSADLLALRQMAAGELLMGYYNSYSLNGVEKLSEIDPDGALSSKETFAFLEKQSQFGKLRSDNTITKWKELGSDMSSALKWAIQYQKELCPSGHEDYNQRKGHLFSLGICLTLDGSENDARQFVTKLDQALGGPIALDLENADGDSTKTNVDIFAWSKKPILDLRSIMPTSYNECGLPTSLRDNTLGGTFVENNYNQFLNKTCE